MNVCHVGTKPLEEMGSITRTLVKRCAGKHAYVTLDEPTPVADVYVLHCFKKCWRDFFTFAGPRGRGKIVSLMHSSAPCVPSLYSDVVVTLTRYSAWDLERRALGKTLEMVLIPGGIDAPVDVGPSRDIKSFGCIIRNAEGKFHLLWNATMRDVLTEVPESTLFVITNKPDGLLEHPRARYAHDVKINDDERKYALLKQLSVAVFMHGVFEEVFPMAVLECMSIGLPVVYAYQPSMREMVGDSQACCGSPSEVKQATMLLLNDASERARVGARARMRALEYSVDKMVRAWDALLRAVVA